MGEIVYSNQTPPTEFGERGKDYYYNLANYLIENNYPVPTTDTEKLARYIYEKEKKARKEEQSNTTP